MHTSRKLDRSKITLPETGKIMLSDIKKKLNIKDFNDIKTRSRKEKIHKPTSTLTELYKLLNKISPRTFDKLSGQIYAIINDVVEENNNHSEICQKFFDIISNDAVCSSIYAKLFYEIVSKHDEFRTMLRSHINLYLDEFKDITYVSSNENYDKYCEYVKQIDKKTNFTLFLIQCFKCLICSLDDMVQIVVYLQERILQTLEKEECIHENEQITNTLCLLLDAIVDMAIFHEEWDIICENHRNIQESTGKGKTSKLKFKIMDIDDIIFKNKTE
jgi:hypothetical protein